MRRLILDEAGMQALMETMQAARDNDDHGVPMLDNLFANDGSPRLGEGTLGFALSLAEGIDAQAGMADYLMLIAQLGDGDWTMLAPLPPAVEPGSGPMP